METYVLTAPVFDFGKIIKTIGDREEKHGIDIPVPHAFVKSVFAEKRDGSFGLWTFKIDNEGTDQQLSDFLVKTYDAEQYVGGRFWDRVSGGDLHEQKRVPGEMWITKSALKRMAEADVVAVANSMGLNASVQDRKNETIDMIISALTA